MHSGVGVEVIYHSTFRSRYPLKKCIHVKIWQHCFAPNALTTEHRRQGVSHAEDLFEVIENDLDFVDLIITGDESCNFIYDPLTKWQSVFWIGPKFKLMNW